MIERKKYLDGMSITREREGITEEEEGSECYEKPPVRSKYWDKWNGWDMWNDRNGFGGGNGSNC